MKQKDLYLWIASYMLLSIPFSLLRHYTGMEATDLPFLYAAFAVIKVALCIFYFKKAGMNSAQRFLLLGTALLLRLVLGAPWLALCIGGVIFHSAETKKVS